MIDARELRIGNLVFEGYDEPWDQIGEVSIDGMGAAYELENGFRYDPIPLSPEWLQKLGFEKRVLNGIRIGSYDTIDWDVEYYIDNILLLKQLSQQYDRFQSANKPYRFIQYVHQLQNLYFALTGTELTVRQ